VAIGRAIVATQGLSCSIEPLSQPRRRPSPCQMRIELTRLHDVLSATMIYVTTTRSRHEMANKIVVPVSGGPDIRRQCDGSTAGDPPNTRRLVAKMTCTGDRSGVVLGPRRQSRERCPHDGRSRPARH